LQVFRSDLEQGKVPLKAGGCGTYTLGGVASSYPLCTGWQFRTFDASFLGGKLFRIRIIADEGGIDPGVATSFAIENLKFNDDRQYGVNIIRRAIEEPLRQIAANAGEEGSIVVQRVREGKGTFGYNAATEEYGDLLKQGVVQAMVLVAWVFFRSPTFGKAVGVVLSGERCIQPNCLFLSHSGDRPPQSGHNLRCHHWWNIQKHGWRNKLEPGKLGAGWRGNPGRVSGD
jgi:hypothetical protein